MTLPANTHRLFAQESGIHPQRHSGWLIERVLEDGDSRDLRWLFQELPREQITEWVQRYGERRLSCRSRVFWRRFLKLDPAVLINEGNEALWPL